MKSGSLADGEGVMPSAVGALQKSEEVVPKVEEIAFVGHVKTSLDDIFKAVSAIPYYSAKMEKGEVEIVRVESRNIRKKPFLFHMLKISEDGMRVIYSIAPDTSLKIRRLSVIKNVAAILSMISAFFEVDLPKLLQYIDSSIDDVLNSISENYSVLFNMYDSLLNEYKEMKRLDLELSAANRNLTIQTAQLSDENKRLSEQLKTLQTYSDESLMAMVQDWIEAHNSSIDIDEFAQTYKLTVPRVEQILDKMVSMGYIELKG